MTTSQSSAEPFKAENIPYLLLLSDEQRLALILLATRQCGYEDVAECMQTKLGTTKSRIHRARAKLAGLIALGAPRPSADTMRNWDRETIVFKDGILVDPLQSGPALMYKLASGTAVNMPMYNAKILRALATAH